MKQLTQRPYSQLTTHNPSTLKKTHARDVRKLERETLLEFTYSEPVSLGRKTLPGRYVRCFENGADQTSSRCEHWARWQVSPTNLLGEAQSQKKRTRNCCCQARPTASSYPSACCYVVAIATNPGILDPNAALPPFGSTRAIKRTIFSNKCLGALFRDPSKQRELTLVLSFLSTKVAKTPKMEKKGP